MPNNITPLLIELLNAQDKFGVLVQPDGDGGDSLNRTALLHGAKSILGTLGNTFCSDLSAITVGLPFGRYRRHPDPTRWYYNENNVTRDQMGPTEAALALYGLDLYLKAHLKLRIKRLLFHFDTQNGGMDMGPIVNKLPDPVSPEEIAVMIRGLGWWLLYPLLLLLDVSLVFSVQSDLQEGQAILNVAVANRRYSTPFAKIARELLKTKPTADEELRAYHSVDRNGILPLGELMILAKKAL